MPYWTGDEPCVDQPGLFYPLVKGSDIEEDSETFLRRASANAKQLCRACPLQADCAEYAIAHELYGIWGGLTPTERSTIRAKRGITVNHPDWFGWLPPVRVEDVA